MQKVADLLGASARGLARALSVLASWGWLSKNCQALAAMMRKASG